MITADINIGRVAVYVNALDETVIASEERPVDQKTDVLDVLKEMIGRVLERVGTVRTILACAISVTGVVNEDKGIVVVSRSSEAAQATGAVSSEELASKRTVAVAQANAASPHTKGVHPDGPDATREAGA